MFELPQPNQDIVDEVLEVLGAVRQDGRGADCEAILAWARGEIDEIYAWEKSPAAMAGGLMGHSVVREQKWRALLDALYAKLAVSDCEQGAGGAG